MKLSLLFVCALALSPITAERFCFEYDSPKAKNTITFDSNHNRITDGNFKVLAQTGKERNVRFYGTKSGTVYVISFKGKPPYRQPKGDDTIIWTRNNNTLEVPMAGKKPKTGKYADFTAKFELCKRR